MSALPGLLALAVTGAGPVAAAVALATTRRPLLALKVLLDLLLAAGLLRLTGDPGWTALITAAVIVALRRLIGAGLRTAGHTWSGGGAGDRPRRGRMPSVHQLVRPAWRT